MSVDELPYLMALCKIEGIGPILAKQLIAYCGGAKAVFETNPKELQAIPNIGKNINLRLKNSFDLKWAEKEIEYCHKNDIKICSFYDPDYPLSLKNINNSPVILYYKGNIPNNDHTSIAIIGTRKPSTYGKKIAKEFTSYFANLGINIVSGLAYGIDAEAHRSTIENNGKTTAVLAHGLDTIYPRNHHSLSIEILQKNGCLLTEYPSKTQISPSLFPFRNRLIAGLVKAVVVIEATLKSGTFVTARIAFDENREVYAVPGAIDSPNSEGCNRLIRDNIAKLLSHPNEVLQDIDFKAHSSENESSSKLINLNELTENEQRLIEKLKEGTKSIDGLAETLNIPITEINITIFNLDLQGLIKLLPGNQIELA